MNQLKNEASLYLRQHRENPVNWYPWGEAAIGLARESNRPILLSIGYSACHWCHVMAHESFEDPVTAAVMNEHFINIKVDREERPDLDRVFQLSHQLLTGRSGGWPLTIFMEPGEQIPFFAGTYFPPQQRHGMPAFADVLVRVKQWYDDHPNEMTDLSGRLREAVLQTQATESVDGAATASAIEEIPRKAAQQLLALHDEENGGYGTSPKFPQAPLLSAIMDLSAQALTEAEPLADSLRRTLTSMARGGLRDHLDGGFFRYCVDATWTIPHFEKMLYDNAMLLPVYAEAAKRWNEPLFEASAAGIVDWLANDMRLASGGFSASIDADADGVEGGFHVWTREQVQRTVREEHFELACQAYGMDMPCNFEGKAWHLVRRRQSCELADRFGLDENSIDKNIEATRALLIAKRNERIPPSRDAKQITAWNALAASGLIHAATALGRETWLDLAADALEFMEQACWDGKRLWSVHYEDLSGKSREFAANLDDYAFLLDAEMAMLQARWTPQRLQFACTLAEALQSRFEDRKQGGFYFSDSSVEIPIGRTLSQQDDATPAGAAVAALSMQQLGHLTGNAEFIESAEKVLLRAIPEMQHSPAGFAGMLSLLLQYDQPPAQLIIGGTDIDQQLQLKKWVETRYRVHCYAIGMNNQAAPGIPGGLETDLPLCAWLCHQMKCLPPVQTRAELERCLEDNDLERHVIKTRGSGQRF